MPTLQQIQKNNEKQQVKGIFGRSKKRLFGPKRAVSPEDRTPKLIGGKGEARVMVDPIKTLGHEARPRKRSK